jgi:ABC-type Fe3+/spermidine/putrescine transport system ATPase subunit
VSTQRFELINVTKRYGTTVALDDISLSFESGQHTAILGPSGCGKSTLLRLLAGLDVPTTGQILLNGNVASKAADVVIPPHERGIAMVFQDLALWPNLSALENVALGLAGLRLSRSVARRRASQALDHCGIVELADRKPSELSGGQQQRVALARAVATAPRFLLLDEPLTGLDIVTRKFIAMQIADAARTCGATAIWVTHDASDADILAPTMLSIQDGRCM